ncbi:solute carrier family 2, facilitated glucose transporter member 8-like [Pararge aegeria]|uniref:solute carrier family 2, facilitated glucose transporter member 8-like n=1 Tax=Pararge aegeria TaxID=116150 RepID=UPI0019D1B9D2|nr:solute carrier family 2, facilitated glucose transporter member 8-like [Pararge aegeria]
MLKNTVKKYCMEGSKVNQVMIAILMVLPVFSYGTAVGWLSPMGPRLMSEETPAAKPVHPDVISWMASVPYLVGTPAVFLFGYIVDNYGRKKALMLTSLSMAVCWGLKLYSTETWALITARAIIGLGVSGSYVVTPLYIKEISEDSIRGTLGSLVVLSQNLGNLVVYVLGEYLCYHAILWICLAIPLLHLLLFAAMPETPSYLLKSGKVEDARSALAWLRCRPALDAVVDTELQLLLLELEQDNNGSFFTTIKTLVSDSSTFRAFRITMAITLARELCGCLAVLHFASLIFSQASGGWVLTANQQAAVLGVVQLVGSCTASSLVERTGRKPLLGTTCFVSGIALGALGAWFAASEGSHAWLPVLALCLCIYCDAAGLQPVPFVVMTEMFSFQYRGTVTSIVTAFACAIVSIELRVFQPLATSVGLYLIFWIFSAVCLISTVYIVFCVPETKRRTIEEIYAEFGGKEKEKDLEAHVTRL